MLTISESRDTIESRIRGFVLDNFLFGDPDRLPSPDTSFIDNDIVDSTGILDLVAFVEAEFGITVEDSEIVPANFDSIAQICAFVSRKRE